MLNYLPKVHHRFLLFFQASLHLLGAKELRTPYSKHPPSQKCVCKVGAVWSLTPTSMIANFLKNFRILLIFRTLHREDCTHAATGSAPIAQCIPKKPWKGLELKLIFSWVIFCSLFKCKFENAAARTLRELTQLPLHSLFKYLKFF